MVDFWSSVTMQTGTYFGKPHAAHNALGLTTEHFSRWLDLFDETIDACCTGFAAALFRDRARRIADSLQIGLNIGPKALHFPAVESTRAGRA
jgi:hemoglobin